MMNCEGSLERLRRRFGADIEDAIEDAIGRAGLEESTLAEMLAYQMNTGGKRLRAVLPLRVAEAMGHAPEGVVAFGAACELIHNATLIHDDLQDGDRMRRGQQAVWVRFGDKEAVNLGDAILYLAPLCLHGVDVDSSVRWEVVDQMCRQVLRLIAGQQGEFELSANTATFDDYERVVAGKTGGLFALPLAGTARLCGAAPEVVSGLEKAGRRLGVLFQIQDDLLDLYGQKGRDAPGGDLREGKVSALVVAFMQQAGGADGARLVEVLDTPRQEVDQRQVRWAAEQFREYGAVDRCFGRIDQLHREVRRMETVARRPELVEVIDELVERVLRPIDDIE